MVAFYWEIRISPAFCNRMRNPKRISPPEIRPQGRFQLRNSNPDFMDFIFTVRLGIPKKDLQDYSRG